MNIVLLSHKFLPDIGGIETMTLFLAEIYCKANYNVKVITWTQGISNEKFSFKVIRQPKAIDIIKEIKWADIVLENNPTMRLSWPLLFTNKPLVIVFHTWLQRTNARIGWQDRIKKLWLKRANKIIAVSNALANNLPKNTLVIKNPYRDTLFKIDENIVRDKDFVFLGRLVSDKGPDLAITALYELNKKGLDKNLTIIGDGPEKENLKKLSSSLDLDSKINFKSSLFGEELVMQLNKHNFLLVPSVWEEPFGLVVLEAMACGCIPIVSNSGGLPEALGNAGLLFDKGNLNALVEKMEYLITNTTLRDNFRNEAISHLKNHNSEIIGKKYLDVVKNLLRK
tara:strand:+ start:1079 stop:2095 length:1017 start_codon:yes stop_codon:yes gene_type:complete